MKIFRAQGDPNGVIEVLGSWGESLESEEVLEDLESYLRYLQSGEEGV